jgi:hypothetical protein
MNLELYELIKLIIEDRLRSIENEEDKQSHKYLGAKLGLEECNAFAIRMRPLRIVYLLSVLLKEAHSKAILIFESNKVSDYFYWRCREAEIEWVSNIVSVYLIKNKIKPIVTPSVIGVLKYNEIMKGLLK